MTLCSISARRVFFLAGASSIARVRCPRVDGVRRVVCGGLTLRRAEGCSLCGAMGANERRAATQDARGSRKYVSSASAQEWQLFRAGSQSLLSSKLGLQKLLTKTQRKSRKRSTHDGTYLRPLNSV